MTAIRAGSTVTEEIATKLRHIGIITVVDFIRKDPEDIAQLSGIAYKDLLALRKLFLAQYSAFPRNGADVYDSEVTSTSILPTGCSSMDKLLDGGLYTSEITEVAGGIAAGKTQFCMSCTVTVATELRQNVIYLDTTGTFSAQRFLEITEAKYGSKDMEQILSSVKCIHLFDIFSLLSELEDIRSRIVMKKDDFYDNLRLIVIDNIPSVIYPVLGGQQMDGHGLMVQLGQKLKHLAIDFQLTILITNNIVNTGGENTASLGKTWSHIPHTRVVLTQNADKTSRQAVLLKTSRMMYFTEWTYYQAVNSDTHFSLGCKGIQDPG